MSIGLCLLASQPAHASAFATYGRAYRTLAMPPNGPGSSAFFGDCLPGADGRIIGVTGNAIYLERSVGSAAFDVVATFDPAQSAGAADPAFVSISPDGTRLAVGLGFGKPVAIVPLASLGTPASPTSLTGSLATYFPVPHYRAAWQDAHHLALTAGTFGSPSQVTLLDTLSSPAAPSNPTIITNIGGASAAIAFDSAGRLYTGNGFDLGPASPSTTGTIKAFDPAAWSSGAADFESPAAGRFIADILSADALLFDSSGNLVIGGGDFNDGDTGYLGVLSSSAIAAAIAGLPIDTADPSQLKRLTPGGSAFDYYSAAYNRATGDLYATLTDFLSGANTWHATVPTPAAALTILIGTLTVSRRRR
ncbi:MAG: hypothetical protein IT438_02135 [Phycisphaerales bacterium]|nr:hypothetical protein [Phycisphaerales bacterium]